MVISMMFPFVFVMRLLSCKVVSRLIFLVVYTLDVLIFKENLMLHVI